jgi:hypothetical protein
VRRGFGAFAFVGALVACRRASHRADDAAPASADAAPWVTPTLVLGRVEVTIDGAADGVIIGREVGRQFARCLIEHGDDVVALDRQVADGRRAVAANLTITLDATTTSDGTGVDVTVAAAIGWNDEVALPRPLVQLAGTATLIDRNRDAAVVAVSDRLLPAACDRLVAQIDLVATDDLHVGLASADPDLVRWTLALVAARRPPAIGAAVATLLAQPPPVRDAAISALVALRDPTTVAALTDRVDLTDRDQVVTTIAAVVAIGGGDAIDFLRVLTAHADPAIARQAEDGLHALDVSIGGP